MTTPSQSPTATGRVHEHPAPPQEDALVRKIAEILLAAYALDKTADALAALLKPYRLPADVIRVALSLAGSSRDSTTHRPNARLKRSGQLTITTARPPRAKGIVKQAREAEVYYRAAYVYAASQRLAEAKRKEVPTREAIAAERPHQRAHEQARRNRLNIAVKMSRLAALYGPILGWYRDPLSASETECYEADGHNFDARVGAVIGYPGSVHPYCKCVAGPPHDEGGWVNDHVHVRLQPVIKRTLKLKK